MTVQTTPPADRAKSPSHGATVLNLSDLATLSAQSQPAPSFLETFKAVVEDNQTNAVDANASPKSRAQNGAAAGAVIAHFLVHHPDAMFDELRGHGLAAFQPDNGPVLVLSGDAVRDVFSRADEFTVDPYGVEMAHVLHSPPPAGRKGVLNFILGTDDARDHTSDRKLLELAVNAGDPPLLRAHLAALCHRQVAKAVAAARALGTWQLDLVTELARVVPLDLVACYMGLPLRDPPVRFELTDAMFEHYGSDIVDETGGTARLLTGTALARGDGVLPDAASMYRWIKTAYECFFNNPLRQFAVRQEGLKNGRLLLCAIQHDLVERKRCIQGGATVARLGEQPGANQVSDGLLTRLIQQQLDGPEEPARHTDLRISENVLGVTLGIMVGLEEAIGRVLEALLKLKEGRYDACSIPAMAGSFDDARAQTLTVLSPESGDAEKTAARDRLTLYFREGLRLEPQAEVLMRQTKPKNNATEVRLFEHHQEASPELAKYAGNRPLHAGELVLVAHHSAMRDLDGPDQFRLGRPDPERTYLFQGYGRHKCLGQYLAPVAAVEIMIALLALDGLQRVTPLQMDAKQLYAASFMIAFADGAITRSIYP